MALELKPDCACCGRDLPPDSASALICSFECTYCMDCAATRLPHGRCPTCQGELVRRPRRRPRVEASGIDLMTGA